MIETIPEWYTRENIKTLRSDFIKFIGSYNIYEDEPDMNIDEDNDVVRIVLNKDRTDELDLYDLFEEYLETKYGELE